jgi:two-component system, NarL family, response regulator DevR
MAARVMARDTAVMKSATARDVFIVDDSPLIRTSLRELLADIDDVKIVGEAETPADAIAGILKLKPTCVVLDFQLREGTGVDVLRAVHPVAPDIAFMVLTNHPTSQYRRLCLGAGASWFLDKSTEFKKIKDLILSCRETAQSIAPSIAPSPSTVQGYRPCKP